MSITATNTLDQIVIDEWGVLSVRVTRRAFDDDGSLIGQRFMRSTLEPGSDVSTQPVVVRRVAQAVWTQAVIDAWNAKKAADLAKVLGV
jgi:hypothetical protein